MKRKSLRISSLLLVIVILLLGLSACVVGGEHTVTLVLGNGEEEKITIPDMGILTEPSPDERENYMFVGWYDDKDMRRPHDFTKTVRSDMTLFAKWIVDYEELTNKISSEYMSANVEIKIAGYNRFHTEYRYVAGAIGSGIIFSRIGNKYYALTCNHVVNFGEFDKCIYVASDFCGKEYDSELVYYDSRYDLAIISFISDEEYRVLDISENSVNKQDAVIALGQPGGQKNAITYGNIKDFTKVDMSSDESVVKLDFEVYCHSAYIKSGSSGGVLLDMNLDIAGINFATSTDSEGIFVMAYAIPSEKIKSFILESGI